MKRWLGECEPGDVVQGFYALTKVELRSKKDGSSYLRIRLSDRTGHLPANLWENIPQWREVLTENSVVKVKGKVDVFQDVTQIRIEKIRPVEEKDQIDRSDFLPSTDIDLDKAYDSITGVVNSLSNPHLKTLLHDLLSDEKFAAALKEAPAGKKWHHDRLGGLLEHTASMLRICRFLARHYRELDRDLLIAGVILHDIGKVEEYGWNLSLDYTDRGRLVGHITLGAHWVMLRAQKIDGFPQDLLNRLVHLILSHQAEFGSPVQPVSAEAFVLHYVDQIDSKLDALRRMRSERSVGERWKFVKLLGRYVDLGEEPEPEE